MWQFYFGNFPKSFLDHDQDSFFWQNGNFLPQKKLLVNLASYLLPPVFLFVANFRTLAINKKRSVP
jgi:hypothetical protein